MVKILSKDFEYPSHPKRKQPKGPVPMSIMDKLKKNSKSKLTSSLATSKFFNDVESIPTHVPMINVALSGSIQGGITPGLTVIAGESKHFKSSFALLIAAAYLRAKPNSAVLFYDSEFGSKMEYFKSFGIDPERVIHTPITNVEELKFDIIAQLEGLDESDDVIIVIDSIGNLASKKELEDAVNEKSVADMSRAKALKGLFRMCTPYLSMKRIPMIAINHTYKEIGMFPKDVVGGGTGIYYSADTIWIVGRRQDKAAGSSEVRGYHFIINVDKSRVLKEKSKIPITVSWEDGVMPYSGLLDVALAGGFVAKVSKGWYQIVGDQPGEYIGDKVRERDTATNGDFWNDLLSDDRFLDFVQNTYSIGGSTEVNPEAFLEQTEEY